MRVATPNSALRAAFKSDHHRASPALDQPDTKALWLRSREIRPDGPVRNIFKERSAKTKRFDDFIEPHLNTRGNVA